jgi:TolA-binding protein
VVAAYARIGVRGRTVTLCSLALCGVRADSRVEKKDMIEWRILSLAVACGLVVSLGETGRLSAQQPAASSNEALQVYADAANFQNGEAFDLAAEEWQKFLKNHPTDPLAAKAQHYLGVCQLQLKQTEAAAGSFAAVIKNHPNFELLEDTWLNLASCQYTLASGGKPELYPQAADSFATLLKEFPKGQVRR